MRYAVTRCYAVASARIARCMREGGYKRGESARFAKRHAHRRMRAAERRFLAREDWDNDFVRFMPVTGWDVD